MWVRVGVGDRGARPGAEGTEKMASLALLSQVGKLRVRKGMGCTRSHRSNVRARLELRCPAFQTGCIYGWTKETSSAPREQALQMGCL